MVIYFNKDSQINAKEYAEDAKLQATANKVSSFIDKLAVGMCSVVSIVAIAILVSLMFV